MLKSRSKHRDGRDREQRGSGSGGGGRRQGEKQPRPPAFCNASLVALPRRPTGPVSRPFLLPEHVRDACAALSPPRKMPYWKGQNLCWEWTKQLGCYETFGTLSWRDGQDRAATRHMAPVPEAVRLEPLQHPEVCERYELGAPLRAKAAELKAATVWLRKNVAVYVVNLPEDTERLRAISDKLSLLNITFQRIPGIDLTKKNAYKQARWAGQVPKSFNFTLAQDNANKEFQAMGGLVGTVGCAAAHLSAMKHVARHIQHRRPLALILEDDAMLVDDFALKLQRLVEEEAPCDWEAISLKAKCPYGECVSPHLTRVYPDVNEPADRCRHGVNYGFFAMLYRGARLAGLHKRLTEVVWDEARPHCLDVDVALASISDEVAYYAVPGMQKVGFLTEGDHGSSRWSRNWKSLADGEEASKTETMTTSTTTTSTTTTTDKHAVYRAWGGIAPTSTTTTERGAEITHESASTAATASGRSSGGKAPPSRSLPPPLAAVVAVTSALPTTSTSAAPLVTSTTGVMDEVLNFLHDSQDSPAAASGVAAGAAVAASATTTTTIDVMSQINAFVGHLHEDEDGRSTVRNAAKVAATSAPQPARSGLEDSASAGVTLQ